MDLIGTYVINKLATDFTGVGSAVSITGLLPSDIVVINKPAIADDARLLYDAWSGWNSDTFASPPVPVFGQTWTGYFKVADATDIVIYSNNTLVNPDLWATPAEALAEIQDLCPIILSGSDTYKFYNTDSPATDNRGGLSLLVTVYRRTLAEGAGDCPEAVPVVAASGTGLPKLQARITVPTGGWQAEVTDGGGSRTATVPAGEYYWSTVAPSGSVSLSAALAAALSGGGVTYTVMLDDQATNSTGRVSIAPDAGTFSLTWTSTVLRDVCGFAADISSSALATGSKHARYLWLPNVQRTPESPDPIGDEDAGSDFGWPEFDYLVATAPSGATATSVFSERWLDLLAFDSLLGSKVSIGNETIANESLVRFMRDVMAAGGVPFRYHPHREDDTTKYSLQLDADAAQLKPAPFVPGWVGPRSLWRWQVKVRKYIPTTIDGVLS